MKYLNASEVLPPELFKEIQKYAGGSLLYVPLAEEQEKTWGVQSAKEYNDNDLLEEWIHTYLLFERKNKEFSDGLYLEDRFYLGPLAMPLRMFVRSSGPEEGIKWQVDPVIMWTTKESDYNDFIKKYSPYTEFVLK